MFGWAVWSESRSISVTDLLFSFFINPFWKWFIKAIPCSNFAAKYFDSDIFQILISSQKLIIKNKTQFVWFGLTVSFLMNSDITRGLGTPLSWPKSSAEQWVKTKTAHSLLPGYFSRQQGSLGESHALGETAVQGTATCVRAAMWLHFQITWRARPLTWPTMATRRVKGGYTHSRAQLILAGVGKGRVGGKGGHHLSDL